MAACATWCFSKPQSMFLLFFLGLRAGHESWAAMSRVGGGADQLSTLVRSEEATSKEQAGVQASTMVPPLDNIFFHTTKLRFSLLLVPYSIRCQRALCISEFSALKYYATHDGKGILNPCLLEKASISQHKLPPGNPSPSLNSKSVSRASALPAPSLGMTVGGKRSAFRLPGDVG